MIDGFRPFGERVESSVRRDRDAEHLQRVECELRGNQMKGFGTGQQGEKAAVQ